MKKKLTIAVIVIMAIVATSFLLVYSYLNKFSKDIRNNKDSSSFIEHREVKIGEPLNILFMGLDIGTVGSKNSPKRTDTMMLFHYDPKTNEGVLVSIPRDTKVVIDGRNEKINAANVFGGSALAVESVENLIDVDINYYVQIDYMGFRKFIDAIGGIDVVIPYDMNYDAESQDLHIHFKKGEKVHLNGEKAEEFIRWRKNNNGTGYVDGDLGRIKTQQEFIMKVVDKIKSPSIILKLPSILSLLPDYIVTNMEPAMMLSLSKEIPKINSESIKRFTLQGDNKYINNISYIVYDPSKNADIIAMVGGKSAPEDNNFDASDVRVQVLNGSGVTGIAAYTQKMLEEKGYKVESIGNISGTKFSSSYIIDRTIKGGAAKNVASELDISNIKTQQDNTSKIDIVIILGLDKESMLDSDNITD